MSLVIGLNSIHPRYYFSLAYMLRQLISLLISLALLTASLSGQAQESPLRVAVIDNSAPMSYIDSDGKLAGFNVAIAEALCAEMKVKCKLILTKLDFLVDDLAAGTYDFAALGLLVTPERQKKILFSQSIYRSTTIWLAKPGVHPGAKNVRVSTFRGSLQEKYAKSQGWDQFSSHSYDDFIEQVSAGVTNAMIAPLMTSIALQKDPRYLTLGLVPTPLRVAELEGEACFGINPKRSDLKEKLDKSLFVLRENGTYGRINSQYLPFRVN